MDLSPLRRFPHFRNLWVGYLVSTMGSQLTVVAVPYQVYRSTHSSLQVGLVSLAQLGALLVGSLGGGVVADHFDRRRLLVASQLLLAACSVALALNAGQHRPSLLAVYLASSAAAGLSGIGGPARSALVIHLVDRESLVAANAVWQLLMQLSVVVGPSLAGLLLARLGLPWVYGIDAATFLAAIAGALLLRVPPLQAERGGLSFRSLAEGFGYLGGHRLLQGVYVVDLNAMIFGMPRALFPALALGRFHGGAGTLGLLYAAPGAGALAGAIFTGRASTLRRQGLAVLVAVGVWGLAVTGFGLMPLLAPALALLAVAGAADVVSALFRGVILQLEAPEELRGRIQAVQFAVVTGGPRLGDVESAGVADAFGVSASVVSGGLACLAGLALIARLLPELARYRSPAAPQPALEAEASSSLPLLGAAETGVGDVEG